MDLEKSVSHELTEDMSEVWEQRQRFKSGAQAPSTHLSEGDDYVDVTDIS